MKWYFLKKSAWGTWGRLGLHNSGGGCELFLAFLIRFETPLKPLARCIHPQQSLPASSMVHAVLVRAGLVVVLAAMRVNDGEAAGGFLQTLNHELAGGFPAPHAAFPSIPLAITRLASSNEVLNGACAARRKVHHVVRLPYGCRIARSVLADYAVVAIKAKPL